MNEMNNLDIYKDIIEVLITRLINREESNSLSQMIIVQLGILIDTIVEIGEYYINTSDNEELLIYTTEMISSYELLLERMIRAYDRCSLISDSNNDIVIYERAFNYIVDMFVNQLLEIDGNVSIDEFYKEIMIIFQRTGISMARNALRFRLCRELIDILRDVILIMNNNRNKIMNIDTN